jgi:hypothetical protein
MNSRFGKIPFCVVGHFVCTDGSHEIKISGTANPGHIRAEVLGELNCRSADRTGSAIDQHTLSASKRAFLEEIQDGRAAK